MTKFGYNFTKWRNSKEQEKGKAWKCQKERKIIWSKKICLILKCIIYYYILHVFLWGNFNSRFNENRLQYHLKYTKEKQG